MKKIFSAGNRIRILLHLLAWTILLILPIYFINRWKIGSDFVWLYYINATINGVIFYVNYLFLIPKYFFGNRKYRYYISVGIFIIGFYFISDTSNKLVFRYIPDSHRTTEQVAGKPNSNERTPPPHGDKRFGRPPFRQMHLYNYAITSLFLTFFALGLRGLERSGQIEKRQKELEKEKLNSELAFLKNQISPHFFFNTLNNIYSLISISVEDSQKAVLKLSKLMRYLLYESEHGQTSLSSEIEFMNNYIDLMRLRMSEKVILNVYFPQKYRDISIPPLLFIPFVENAFKHGVSYRENSYIDISMQITEEHIVFNCKNSLGRVKGEAAETRPGIGLENVSKRLNLLFPNRHLLRIVHDDSAFSVELTIDTNKGLAA